MDITYYSNIINLPHHQSLTRRHMSLHDRAAQFAPFAALKGYEEALREKEKIIRSFKSSFLSERGAVFNCAPPSFLPFQCSTVRRETGLCALN